MDVSTALRTNGAVRGFTADPVSDAVVAELLDAGSLPAAGGSVRCPEPQQHRLCFEGQLTEVQLAPCQIDDSHGRIVGFRELSGHRWRGPDDCRSGHRPVSPVNAGRSL